MINNNNVINLSQYMNIQQKHFDSKQQQQQQQQQQPHQPATSNLSHCNSRTKTSFLICDKPSFQMENDDNDNDNDNDDNDDDKQCHPPEASTGAPYSKNQLNWSQNS